MEQGRPNIDKITDQLIEVILDCRLIDVIRMILDNAQSFEDRHYEQIGHALKDLLNTPADKINNNTLRTINFLVGANNRSFTSDVRLNPFRGSLALGDILCELDIDNLRNIRDAMIESGEDLQFSINLLTKEIETHLENNSSSESGGEDIEAEPIATMMHSASSEASASSGTSASSGINPQIGRVLNFTSVAESHLPPQIRRLNLPANYFDIDAEESSDGSEEIVTATIPNLAIHGASSGINPQIGRASNLSSKDGFRLPPRIERMAAPTNYFNRDDESSDESEEIVAAQPARGGAGMDWYEAFEDNRYPRAGLQGRAYRLPRAKEDGSTDSSASGMMVPPKLRRHKFENLSSPVREALVAEPNPSAAAAPRFAENHDFPSIEGYINTSSADNSLAYSPGMNGDIIDSPEEDFFFAEGVDLLGIESPQSFASAAESLPYLPTTQQSFRPIASSHPKASKPVSSRSLEEEDDIFDDLEEIPEFVSANLVDRPSPDYRSFAAATPTFATDPVTSFAPSAALLPRFQFRPEVLASVSEYDSKSDKPQHSPSTNKRDHTESDGELAEKKIKTR